MFMTYRKQTSASRLNTTEVFEKTPNESFADSAIGKRFTRKKVNDDQGRTRKLSRASDSCTEQGRQASREGLRTAKMSKFMFKPEDLFLHISETPSKNGGLIPPASSDRTTEASFLPELQDREGSFLGIDCAPGREFLTEFREELEMKNGEVMLLEDEVLRLRRALVAKEEEHGKLVEKKTLEMKQEISALKENIKELKTSLQERNETVKQQKKNENTLTRQIKSLKYEKLMLEKQLDDLYKKKLPKDLKDIMSYRQHSLMVQVEELKQRLEESKTVQEALLEQEVLRLKEKNLATVGSLNTLNAHSHVLSKKLSDRETDLREKTENFGRCYSALKENHSVVLSQLKQARKENMKLRCLNPSKRNKKGRMVFSSSEESLTFSLASNN